MTYIPDGMAKWKREAKAHYHQDSQFFEDLFNDAKTKVLAGTAEPCFVATLVEDKHDLNIRSMSWLCGTLFGAGAETTAGSLSVFILAMVLYPEITRRAQAQIDAVVGRDRLPNFGDRAQLPYIEALVKEVQRWRPGAPIGVPRQATEDDFYNGYFIPKGTLVLLNIWAINRDSDYFPDFDEFRPERYLDEREQLIEPMPNTHAQGHMSYGTGRRMCVGKDLANQTLFIDFATLLWACNIDKAIGADGNPIIPSQADFVDEGVVVYVQLVQHPAR
ncbi:hypothetical protein EIP86_001492 [Pleurotus ostreatoroseus]|nr:hypothetical protein EIP86_001492 [Pleurotus ostreatoroseus]